MNESVNSPLSASPEELFVVGIAASAGGLAAMIDLLKNASCHKSICFVIVSHVARDRESMLPAILSRVSKLDGCEIQDNTPVKHCGLYVIPANRYVRISDGVLHLEPRPEKVPNNCADYFFKSLAESYGPNAIGVVLSGSMVGEDGARGVEAIKKRGGHTYAQDPQTADFPAMPEAAIATGCIDAVMVPEEIGHELSLVSWAP